MDQLVTASLSPDPITYLSEPIPPVSCLTTQLPLRFHGLYEAMVDPKIALTPSGAPEIDVLAMDNSQELVDEALQFAAVHGWSGEVAQQLVQQVRRLLMGEAAVLEDWRLWQVNIEGDYTLGLCLAKRNEEPLSLATVRLPMPRHLSTAFRIINDRHSIDHKLFVDMRWTSENGRELKVSEWRRHHKITQVSWWLDVDDLRASEATQPDPRPIEAFKRP